MTIASGSLCSAISVEPSVAPRVRAEQHRGGAVALDRGVADQPGLVHQHLVAGQHEHPVARGRGGQQRACDVQGVEADHAVEVGQAERGRAVQPQPRPHVLEEAGRGDRDVLHGVRVDQEPDRVAVGAGEHPLPRARQQVGQFEAVGDGDAVEAQEAGEEAQLRGVEAERAGQVGDRQARLRHERRHPFQAGCFEQGHGFLLFVRLSRGPARARARARTGGGRW
ncbi:hypothetical protein [Amycolatopsis kentuckyensis]|uniref:hypothetical protein n=1 Tax=Amycolatopsis kentuckyensis TaxID=218823 RepID=UPI000A3AE6F2|nr:hypothetical protein [Amycolatopsis kentuckyensis]